MNEARRQKSAILSRNSQGCCQAASRPPAAHAIDAFHKINPLMDGPGQGRAREDRKFPTLPCFMLGGLAGHNSTGAGVDEKIAGQFRRSTGSQHA